MAEDTPNTEAAEPAATADRDLVLELNFVPSWARKEPEEGRRAFSNFDGEEDRGPRGRSGFQQRRPRPQGDRPRPQGDRPRPQGDRPRPQGDRPPRPQGDRPRPQGDRPSRPHDGRREGGRDGRSQRPEPIELPPVRVVFLPEQKPLSAIVHRIRVTNRAYPLMEVASFFLDKPDLCYIKLEVDDHNADTKLYQCKNCGMTALTRDILVAHLTNAHFEEVFEKQETVGEPPAGNFVCVARCGLSGTLLGPPNHHSYAERVSEIHKTRYSHLSAEEYSGRIEMLRDPAMVEKWKDESRRQVLYRSRKAAPDAPGMKWSAAESEFLDCVAPTLIAASNRAILTVKVARQMEDKLLRRGVEEAWNREHRFPRTLSLALRAAFRHKHLTVFRAGQGREFVTATEPAPLDPAHVVEPIREVLTYLMAHPGCSRESLLNALRPGVAADAPEAGSVLTPLAWLVEKGHIIEFSDGSMSVLGGVPRATAMPQTPKTAG